MSLCLFACSSTESKEDSNSAEKVNEIEKNIVSIEDENKETQEINNPNPDVQDFQELAIKEVVTTKDENKTEPINNDDKEPDTYVLDGQTYVKWMDDPYSIDHAIYYLFHIDLTLCNLFNKYGWIRDFSLVAHIHNINGHFLFV